MAVITENDLRKHFKNQNLKEADVYEATTGAILTPSAKSFLTDHQIELRYVGESRKEVPPPPGKDVKLQITKKLDSIQNPEEGKKRFRTLYGGFLETKPEHMTHLYGNMLVFKDHPRIVFRGKLDSLESKILEAQVSCFKLGMTKLVDDLEEILLFVRQIVRSEVLSESMDEFNLLGMTAKELREMSHFPKKYFGLEHFQPSYELGEAVVVINSLRTLTRETELQAYQAFKSEHGSVEREDIIRTLNRLSSLFWIMMFRVRVGQYS